MDTVNSTALREGPTMSQRDPSKEGNQLRPRSLRSSGTELDEGCGNLEQAEGGMGLDRAINTLERGSDQSPVPNAPASESVRVPPLMSKAGEALSKKSGDFVDWRNTRIAGR
jgi:hypothetical protein